MLAVAMPTACPQEASARVDLGRHRGLGATCRELTERALLLSAPPQRRCPPVAQRQAF